MINFSAILANSRIGRLVRAPLQLLPRTMVVPILQGRLRGYRWIVGSSDHGCWLGSYGLQKQHLIEEYVQPGATVYDIEANVGFFTLLCSALVGPCGLVAAFEPLEENLAFLRAHLCLNHVGNVRVVDAAVAEAPSMRKFTAGPSRAMGHLATDGDRIVRTVRLDDLLADGEVPPPHVLKIDGECTDDPVLRGAEGILGQFHPVVFLATAPLVSKAESLSMLHALGYRTIPISGSDIYFTSECLATHVG